MDKIGRFMGRLGDAFWRAAMYCLHPRVIGLSLLPLLVAMALAGGFMYFFWEMAGDYARQMLEQWQLIQSLLHWLDSVGLTGFRTVLPQMLVLAVVVPVIIVVSVLLVAMCMTPSVVHLVAARRFPQMDRKRGGSWLQSALMATWFSVVALVALLLTLPLWLIPPLVLIVPPLIWGWLSYKVFSFDVLAVHASAQERRRLLREHQPALLFIGVVSGFVGAAPSLLFAISPLTLVLSVFILPVVIWLYTLVFAFTTAWFAHYALAALRDLRLAAHVPESPEVWATSFAPSSTPEASPGPSAGAPILVPPVDPK